MVKGWGREGGNGGRVGERREASFIRPHYKKFNHIHDGNVNIPALSF